MFSKGPSTLLVQRPPTASLTSDTTPLLAFATGLVVVLGSGMPLASRDALATALLFLIVIGMDRAVRGRFRR